MAEDRKYFIFNKPMDYRRGTVDRMNAADGILRLTGAEPGWFFSSRESSGSARTSSNGALLSPHTRNRLSLL